MKTNRQEVDRRKSTISSLKMVEIKVEHVIKIFFFKVMKTKSQQSCDKDVFNDKAAKFIGQKMPSITKTTRT